MFCLFIFPIFLTACSLNDSKSPTKLEENNNSSKDTTQNTADSSKQKTSPSSDRKTEQNISEKVKNYIINGQENKSEAGKIKWSKTFLDQVDIESLYNQYITTGGNADDIEKFADYMTLNAPIPNDWEKLFEKDLYDMYGEKVVRLEHLEGDLYQAYIKKDEAEIPFVVVSSRTGYFHG